MELHIDRGSSVPIYRQIVREIRGLILSGTLPPGFRLPPERRLARALGVNRTTVITAYRELKAEDLLDARVGRGTEVATRPPAPVAAAEATSFPWRQLLRDEGGAARDPLLRDLLAAPERSDVLSLAVGLPAPELLPLAAVARAQAELLVEKGAELFLHSPTEGVTAFRERLAALLPARGIRCGAAELLVTSGSQQGLDLAARLFLSPGDTVVVDEPCFFGALQVFRAAQARVVGVPADRDGMRTDLLEGMLARHRPKLIYTLPTFQNPSGSLMPLQRRQQLLEVAARAQVPVLEDDPYFELRYEGEAVPSLKALDRHDQVLYLSSFSKVLFPGLRIGFFVAPRVVCRQLALLKQAMDLHSNTHGQWLLERLLASAAYEEHVARVRVAYARRRDRMDEALREHAPAWVRWFVPSGGFYIWCTLDREVSPHRLAARAAELGVSYLPGAACYAGEPPEPTLRLNFTYLEEDRIGEAVARLMAALEGAAREGAGDQGPRTATPPIV